jgi:outer membrane protein TolC
MKSIHTFLLFLLTQSLFAAPLLTLTEDSILNIAKNSSVPELDQIEANLMQAKADQMKAKDTFGVEAYAGYNYAETEEKGLITFIPVFSPIHQYQAGLKKNFKYGLQADLSATVDNRSSTRNNYDSLHTTTYSLKVNLDLWKDAFGRVTRKKLENLDIMGKKSELESEINQKVFKITLRKIYWALVANGQKLEIAQKQYQFAIKQLKDARLRQKNSIADLSEVARYESQTSSRQGSILLVKYERESLLKQLRNFLPEIANNDLEIKSVNVDRTILDVLSCTTLIKTKKQVPYEYTKYDELVSLLKTVQTNTETIDSSYDNIDLKLTTEFKQVGVGSDEVPSGSSRFEGSYDESLANLEDGFSAGLLLTIPIGKKFSDTGEVIKKYNEKRLKANIKSMDNSLLTTHIEISKSVEYLTEIIQAQRSNSKSLKVRLREMQKKFNQARIPVYQLVQDQDALLSSDLAIVDTQLAMLNTLLDYFVVFSDTPCNFNKL